MKGFILSQDFLLFGHGVSCRMHSARGYDLDDLVRQAGNRCKPLGLRHLACRSCDRKCSAPEAEVVARSYPCSCSSFVVVDVVLGNRNRPTAGVRADGHLAACEPRVLLVVVVSAVVEVLVAHERDYSIEPSSLCHSFA